MLGKVTAPLVAVLVVFILTAPVAQAACTAPEVTERYTLLLPTGSDEPPTASPTTQVSKIGIIAYVVKKSDLELGKRFSLEAAGQTSAFCLPNPSQPCIPNEVRLPDFNIQFYNANDARISETHNGIGDESGTIPTNADYAVIWMRYGPDFTLFGDVRTDNTPYGADALLKMGGNC